MRWLSGVIVFLLFRIIATRRHPTQGRLRAFG